MKRSFSANWTLDGLPLQPRQGLQHGNDRPRRYAYDDGKEQDFRHIIALRFSAEELVTDVAEAGSKNGPD